MGEFRNGPVVVLDDEDAALLQHPFAWVDVDDRHVSEHVLRRQGVRGPFEDASDGIPVGEDFRDGLGQPRDFDLLDMPAFFRRRLLYARKRGNA